MAATNNQTLQSELEGLTVYRETTVGWDEHTPPNESLDQYDELVGTNRGIVPVSDPRSPSRRVYDDPEVEALRAELQERNGIRGLEICSPDEVDRAVRIFRRDGFVVVRDLLNAEQLERWREGCARVLKEILSMPGPGRRKYITETGRLPHRYSYGTCSASRQLLHDSVWASMVDLPTTTPILKAIFGSSDYRVGGAGGDLCLPGAIECQHLHSDGKDPQLLLAGRIRQAEALGVELNRDSDGNLDVPTQKWIMEITVPAVIINFLMSDLTWENGPIRQIPGTHTMQQPPPLPADEPDWMRFSTLVGAPAGAGVFRDHRAWHGATPNLSKQVRALPNVEYSASWRPAESYKKTMPHEIWETLTPHGQHICEFVRANPGVWPPGAGVMHPTKSKREEASNGFYKSVGA
ncbi:phytanoyl-CoA dioxygenase family protein [Chloroflexi bacterium TSY]|nr:phytanoyl-CoA dioxygenase family protein [Chloroflexi bacterium TSY]